MQDQDQVLGGSEEHPAPQCLLLKQGGVACALEAESPCRAQIGLPTPVHHTQSKNLLLRLHVVRSFFHVEICVTESLHIKPLLTGKKARQLHITERHLCYSTY